MGKGISVTGNGNNVSGNSVQSGKGGKSTGVQVTGNGNRVTGNNVQGKGR